MQLQSRVRLKVEGGGGEKGKDGGGPEKKKMIRQEGTQEGMR